MRFNKIFFTLTIFLCISLSSGYSQNSDKENDLLDFNVQGIKLGSNLSDFKIKYPDAFFMSSESDLDIDILCYGVSNIPNISSTIFIFYASKLYEIRNGYDVQLTNKLGGWDVVLSTLVNRYGYFDEVTTQSPEIYSCYLIRSNISRLLKFIVNPNAMVIVVRDLDIYDEIVTRKKEVMDLGFWLLKSLFIIFNNFILIKFIFWIYNRSLLNI